MATVGVLSIDVRARVNKFMTAMKKAQKAVHRFVKTIPFFNKFTAALTAFVAGGAMVALTKQSLSVIDAQAKFADRIGVSMDALQSLEVAAQRSGVSISALRMGLQRMTRRVAEAAIGTGEAKGALKELGINAKMLTKLSPEKQLGVIADAMLKVTDHASKVRLAMKLFDSEGVALLNTISGGSKALEDLQRELQKSGVLMSRFDARRIEEVNDSFLDLKILFGNIFNQLNILLAPIIVKITSKLKSMGINGILSTDAIRNGFSTATIFIAKMGDSVNGSNAAFEFFRSIVASTLQLVAKLGVALGKIKLLFSKDDRAFKFFEDIEIFAEESEKNFKKAAIEFGSEAFESVRDVQDDVIEKKIQALLARTNAEQEARLRAIEGTKPTASGSASIAAGDSISSQQKALLQQQSQQRQELIGALGSSDPAERQQATIILQSLDKKFGAMLKLQMDRKNDIQIDKSNKTATSAPTRRPPPRGE